jgi:hypothetical protein
LFVAGAVRRDYKKSVASAVVGEGAAASISIREFLKSQLVEDRTKVELV